MSTPTSTGSPFDALETVFAQLHLPPASLRLDGADIPGLDDRPVALDEAVHLLLDVEADPDTKNRIVNAIVTRAKSREANWMIAASGIVLPGLRRAAAPLVRALPHLSADIEAEMLTGLLTAIRRTRPPIPRAASTLVWAARNHVRRWIRTEIRASDLDDELDEAVATAPRSTAFSSSAPKAPSGHPDLVLAKAVHEGVICAQDAELIAVTRFEAMGLFEAARALGITHGAVKFRRWEAESKIVAWIRGDFLTPRPSDRALCPRGRPRTGTCGTAELQRCRPARSTTPEEVNTPTQVPRRPCRSTPSTTPRSH